MGVAAFVRMRDTMCDAEALGPRSDERSYT
jgi:hypothetical protein